MSSDAEKVAQALELIEGGEVLCPRCRMRHGLSAWRNSPACHVCGLRWQIEPLVMAALGMTREAARDWLKWWVNEGARHDTTQEACESEAVQGSQVLEP